MFRKNLVREFFISLCIAAFSTTITVAQPSYKDTWTYNSNDYRKGEVAHVWQKHGVWQVSLVADIGCVLATKAGVNNTTFYLYFEDDGQKLTFTWADTNFNATNNENFAARNRSPLEIADKVVLDIVKISNNKSGYDASEDWEIFNNGVIAIIGDIDGQRLAMSPAPYFLAWEKPNRDVDSNFSNDGPDALSAHQMLDRISMRQILVFSHGSFDKRISLNGFCGAVNDLYECVRAY